MRKEIVWITGASTGIGAATARILAREGHKVAVTARSVDKLTDLAAGSSTSAGAIIPYPCDVTDERAMADTLARIEQEQGPVTLAILNAGTFSPGENAANFTVEGFRRTFAVNVFGIVHGLAPLMPRMRARNRGHIALMGSVAGYRGLPGALAYCPSKAAVINLAETLAIECLGTGIKVQLINPGFVKTPLTDQNDFEMPMLMDVEDAAQCLVQGLGSSRFEITFPWTFALMLKLVGMLPSRLYFRAVARAARGKMKT